MQWLDILGGADEWERPTPPVGRRDVVVAALVLVLVALSFELLRSFADMDGARPVWLEYLVIVAAAVPLVWRRRHPLLVAIVEFSLFFVANTWVPEVGYQFLFQAVFFFALYGAVAWARDRRQLGILVLVLVVAFALWVAWDLAVGSGIDSYLRKAGDYHPTGIFPRVLAWVLQNVLLNILYLAGAITMGQVAWRQARDRALVDDAALTIARQADELRDQAVVDERLRIARELHDVVAHHVAVIGIQAAGARRALDTRPDLAAEALGRVEESSRQAVSQMRGLLGALRATDGEEELDDARTSQPTLAQLPGLVDGLRDALDVDLRLVEPTPGTLDALPLPLQLSLFRTVQEALTNVTRHSTARRASAVVRLLDDGRAVEAEVLDDGTPRGGTSGTGLGLVGLRERIRSHGGTTEIGPRATGGYRVRVRFPVASA